MMKKIISVFMIVSIVLISFTGCTDTKSSSSRRSRSSASNSDSSGAASSGDGSSKTTPSKDSKYSSASDQLKMPAVGDEIALMKTSLGNIVLRFFPEAAPKAVENFKTHAKNEYYNGLTFHRVITGFMIQGGDPTGSGTGGESIYGQDFEDEFDPNLLNIRGALSMANKGENTNSSQFFIVQTSADLFAGWDDYYAKEDVIKSFKDNNIAEYDINSWSAEAKKIYEDQGGVPYLDGAHRTDGKGHTVFGQVIRGMDVVDKIVEVEVDSAKKPTTDVVIQSVEIIAYQNNLDEIAPTTQESTAASLPQTTNASEPPSQGEPMTFD